MSASKDGPSASGPNRTGEGRLGRVFLLARLRQAHREGPALVTALCDELESTLDGPPAALSGPCPELESPSSKGAPLADDTFSRIAETGLAEALLSGAVDVDDVV